MISWYIPLFFHLKPLKPICWRFIHPFFLQGCSQHPRYKEGKFPKCLPLWLSFTYSWLIINQQYTIYTSIYLFLMVASVKSPCFMVKSMFFMVDLHESPILALSHSTGFFPKTMVQLRSWWPWSVWRAWLLGWFIIGFITWSIKRVVYIYTYMYVHVYIYIYTYMYVHVYIYICIHMYIHIYMHTYVYITIISCQFFMSNMITHVGKWTHWDTHWPDQDTLSNPHIPSGKLTWRTGKSPSLIGKSTINGD